MLLSKEAVCKTSCGVHTASNSYTIRNSPCGLSYGRGRSLLVVEGPRLYVLTRMKRAGAEIISSGNRSIGLEVGAQVIVVSWTVNEFVHSALI